VAKDKYPHFNPTEHKIESKIATVRTTHHAKYNAFPPHKCGGIQL